LFFKTRARKKKFLTDPVEIIPFPKQNLRDKVANQPRPIAPAIKPNPDLQYKQEPTVLKSPTGQMASAMVSIKHLIQKQEEQAKDNVNLNDLPNDAYTFDQVKMLWRRFAFVIKEQGMDTFYNALIKREPADLNDHQYAIDVDNQVQVDYITPHLQEMNAFFRKELNNYTFSVSLRLSENQEEEMKYQTGKDKFMALARKNPNMHTLKTMFNLDVEL
jgi:hypothetical protein